MVDVAFRNKNVEVNVWVLYRFLQHGNFKAFKQIHEHVMYMFIA
jgi:hypothetical protein